MSIPIRTLIDQITLAVTNQGMDLSPSDVGHIVALFLEGLVYGGTANPALDKALQDIADICNSVKDE